MKLIFRKTYWCLGHDFNMKCNQNKIIFLMTYNSSSFDDMKFLARLEFEPKWRHLFFKNFGTLFKFHLYGIEKICANFDTLVIIWTIICPKSPSIADSTFIVRCKIIYCKILKKYLRGLRNHNGKLFLCPPQK